MATPYELNPKVSTILAQICCHNNSLPQGAPTSPVISNMLCARMDSQLRRLAKEYRCLYTRYADDITFSTSMPKFPSAIAAFNSSGQVIVGQELSKIIHSNGFGINQSKVRLQSRYQRQEVTGLTVNKFPNVERTYIRQIRAMLHAWRKFGLNAAQKEFAERYDLKSRSEWKSEPSFEKVVKGKIEFLGMVRGKSNPIYLKFLRQLKILAPELVNVSIFQNPSENSYPIIMTEGKTDWKHLKSALFRFRQLGLFENLRIFIKEYEDDIQMGSGELVNFCGHASKVAQNPPVICIFDRDEPHIVQQVMNGDSWKDWGNNVFSFALPIPSHRQDTPEICIEFFYKNSEIKRVDTEGRRLFISNEFDPRSGQHKNLENTNCTLLNKIGNTKKVTIIDERVFNAAQYNIALPKNEFAENILRQVDNFNDFDFSEFANVLNIIESIVSGLD